MMNMGGVPYQISNPPGSIANWKGQAGEYPTNFMDDQAGEVDYFDVYGEVQTHYSQVRRRVVTAQGVLARDAAQGCVSPVHGAWVGLLDPERRHQPPAGPGRAFQGQGVCAPWMFCCLI